jgi:glycosyltransferase involved in cell wall biosynthesis
MISVIVPTLNSASALPHSFDSLIAATVRGLVREVIVADGGSSDSTLAIADGAGAHIVKGGRTRSSQLIAGAKAARGEWLLFLHPETALEPGWEMEVESFLSRITLERPRAAAFRFAIDDFGGPARRREAYAALRCWLFAVPSGAQGLLVPKRLYQKLGGYRPLSKLEGEDLVRRIGRRRLVMMRSRAVNMTRETEQGVGHFMLAALHMLHLPTAILARFSQ